MIEELKVKVAQLEADLAVARIPAPQPGHPAPYYYPPEFQAPGREWWRHSHVDMGVREPHSGTRVMSTREANG